MSTRHTLAALATLAAATSLGACAARVLDVGSSNPPSTLGGVAAETYAVSGSCTQASCANQSLSCVGKGSSVPATDLECIPHSGDGGPSIFDGTCILVGTCAASELQSCITAPVANDCTGGGACVAASGGSGLVAVVIAPSGVDGGARTTDLHAFFTSAEESGTNAQTFGACVYDPYGATATSGESGVQGPAPNPGTLHATSGGFDATAYAACDGTYADVTSATAPPAGDVVSLAWDTPAGNPWSFPPSIAGVPAPHAVALATGLLASASPTLARGGDVPVTWTVSGQPEALENVVVLVTQAQATLTCTYASSGGSGVIPSEALLQLQAGSATYAVVSDQRYTTGEAAYEWLVTFDVQEVAAISAGLARGALTLE